jgi:hypothetical protein
MPKPFLLAATHKPRIINAAGFCARVAQLDRASVSEAEGYGFNSRRAHQFISSEKFSGS